MCPTLPLQPCATLDAAEAVRGHVMGLYLDGRRRQDPILTSHPGLEALFSLCFGLQFSLGREIQCYGYFQLYPDNGGTRGCWPRLSQDTQTGT